MQFPVNLVLEIRTQEEYDRVQEGLKFLNTINTEDDCSCSVKADPVTSNLDLLKRIIIKLADSAKESRIRINGHQIAMGTTEDMIKRYETESAMHVKSNIVLEEWRDGEYTSIRSRRLQKL